VFDSVTYLIFQESAQNITCGVFSNQSQENSGELLICFVNSQYVISNIFSPIEQTFGGGNKVVTSLRVIKV